MGNLIKNYYDNSQSNDIEINSPMSIDKILELRERAIRRSMAEDAEVVEVETEDGTEDGSFPLSNVIFNPRLFDSTAWLEMLRGVIACAVSMGSNDNEGNGKNVHTLNLMQKNEWYYLMQAFVEAEVTLGIPTAADLYKQMKAWFPEVAMLEEGGTEAKLTRKLTASISAEKAKWKEQGTDKSVPLKEMVVKNQASERMKQERCRDLYMAAYIGLCMKLKELKKEITSIKDGRR